MKFDDNESMETHFTRFDNLLKQVKLSEGKLDNDLVACLLLLTLPESFDMVVTAIKTLSSKNITLEFVRSRLLDKEVKRVSRSSKRSEKLKMKAAFGTNMKHFPFECHFSNLSGHKKSEYWKWKKQLKIVVLEIQTRQQTLLKKICLLHL